MQDVLKIDRSMLATGKTEVEIRAPKYSDLRKARKLFPYDRPDRDRLGYIPEDLMLASLLVTVNGKAVDESTDLIDRLAELPLADKQALYALVNETFYLSKERANVAADNGKAARYEAYEFRSIPANEMPSGKEVKFNMPNTAAQIQCEQNYPGLDKSGVGLEEYMFAYCLTGNEGADKLAVLDDWEIEDVQYAVNYYLACASIDEDTRVNLKKTARTLKQQLRAKPISKPLPVVRAVSPKQLEIPLQQTTREAEDVADLEALLSKPKS